MTKAFNLALSIVKKLNDAGYVAYFAGGWVRDFLLKHPSDDIDIATNATPDIIQSLFSHTVPIGISFGIILVVEDDHPFEVATFRKESDYEDKRRPSSISFTTAVEDAKRRDFTINGLFYDPIKEEILDYVEGEKDLKRKIIRAIGNPHERIQEDRLRMIRAIRFSARLSFEIDPPTKEAIVAHANELFPYVAIERVWQELNKMSLYPNFAKALEVLFEFDLLQQIFPQLEEKSVKNIQRKLQHVKDFPPCPAIAKILELFPHFSLEEKINLCRHFKLSNQDMDFVIFYHETEKMLQKKQIEDFEWAYFFSNKFSEIIDQIIACKMPAPEKEIFLKSHKEKKGHLKEEIRRIQEKDPLVRALHLKEQGIVPGKNMGLLLNLAEKIAINEKINDPDEIIKKLKDTPLWPKLDEELQP